MILKKKKKMKVNKMKRSLNNNYKQINKIGKIQVKHTNV